MAGIILAGGAASRMGKDKALLQWGDTDLLGNSINILREIFDEVIVVSSTVYSYNVKYVSDIYNGQGPLSGILAGLGASNDRYNFITAVDMPFIDIRLIRYMQKMTEGYDIVVPKNGEFLEPLCAIYSKDCIDKIDSMMKDGQKKYLHSLRRLKLYILDIMIIYVTNIAFST
ncbi:MAG: molybdenum cofactor guanylyltransferase [Thermoanaerobacteraceae bacterium]|nr:molybdenum cofactor guanylyltransferase [Thermoanaerobacteraceae bacterium]